MKCIVIDGTEYRFFNHLFAVSRDGRLLRKLEPYAPTRRKDGYFDAGRTKLVHRMVATCWLEKPEGATLVHHINHDKGDNRADNLEWVSPKEHVAEKHKGVHGNYIRSEETRQKLREYRTGQKQSEETKQKQREASLRLGLKPPPRPFGYKAPPEMIAKCRQNNPMNRACEIDGVKYASFSDAGRALNQRPHTLRKRCLSKNFPNYRIVT